MHLWERSGVHKSMTSCKKLAFFNDTSCWEHCVLEWILVRFDGLLILDAIKRKFIVSSSIIRSVIFISNFSSYSKLTWISKIQMIDWCLILDWVWGIIIKNGNSVNIEQYWFQKRLVFEKMTTHSKTGKHFLQKAFEKYLWNAYSRHTLVN